MDCRKNAPKNFTKKTLNSQITTMVWSVTQSHTFWSVTSTGPEEAMLVNKAYLTHLNSLSPFLLDLCTLCGKQEKTLDVNAESIFCTVA